MEANQRDAKLAAARKKLKQFKEKQHKTASPLLHSNGSLDSSAAGSFTNGVTSFNARGSESSAVESILQLSTQLNGLLDDHDHADSPAEHRNGNSSLSNVPNDLEARNRELADMVRKHKETCQQLEKRSVELQRHNEELQRRLEEERDAQSERHLRELQHAKEQLQVHIQTIGILVEEKQTLQKATNLSQRQQQQKADELEELSGRLKASRQRVADLEKQLAQVASSKQVHEQQSKESAKDVDRLKMDVYRKNKELEELSQQKSELTAQLEVKVAQCAELETSVTELSGKLDMSMAYAQQLTGGSSGGAEEVSLYAQQAEELQQEKNELYEKVTQYEDAFRRLAIERDQQTNQYNQIVAAMEERHKQYAYQLQQSISDKDALQRRLDELSEQMELWQREHQGNSRSGGAVVENGTGPEGNVNGGDEKLAELMSHYSMLRLQLEAVTKNCEVMSADNAQLSRLLEEREERLSELESLAERLQDEQESRQRLLNTTQSDKTALSRALSQNRELKAQLEELQDRFVKMANDNMETTTRLQSEEHAARELSARLEQREAEQRVTLSALEERERRLERVEEGEARAARMAFQQEQLADRIRHYEAQGQLVDTLQRELHAAQEAITALTVQNGELRALVMHSAAVQQQQLQSSASGDAQLSNDTARSQEMVASLSAAIRQLEMERNQIMAQYEETKIENDRLLQQIAAQKPPAAEGVASIGEPSGGRVSVEQYESLENAMRLLQDKFTALTRVRAELQDTSERLQHENAQLQGEAETIGDYISMYHHQRTIMKERTEAKDRCIAQLAKEREGVQTKVTELQALVFQLLQEKHSVHPYAATAPSDTAGLAFSPTTVGSSATASAATGRDMLDTSLLQETDEWPDNASDSDTSEVEAIVAHHHMPSAHLLTAPSRGDNASKVPNVQGARPPPIVDESEAATAHKIMALLSEMGHVSGSRPDRPADFSRRVLHCSHCSGPIYSM